MDDCLMKIPIKAEYLCHSILFAAAFGLLCSTAIAQKSDRQCAGAEKSGRDPF
jgi:hypothetical protein